MAYANISKPSSYMNPVLYTGNSSTQAITGVGFQPALVWLKDRDATSSHRLYDAVRGVTERIQSNTTEAETTEADGLTAFGADGFSLGSNAATNDNSNLYVGWNWKAGTTTGIAGSPSITPLSYSFNATSGFSIIKYNGTGSAGTLPHGLGVAPSMIIVKALETTDNWAVYHKSLGATKYTELNLSAAAGTSAVMWNDTEPTSTLFTVNTNGGVNTAGNDYIAYCFANVKGYAHANMYRGNANNDGVFIYTGFRPAFVLLKNITDAGDNWTMYDSKRDPGNAADELLFANSDGVESTGNDMDIVSNGFKQRNTSNGNNGNGDTMIYYAVAQEPLVANVGSSIPATAR